MGKGSGTCQSRNGIILENLNNDNIEDYITNKDNNLEDNLILLNPYKKIDSLPDIKSKIELLQKSINYNKNLYYNDQGVISDEEYDALEILLQNLIDEYKESEAVEDNVLDKVGAETSGLFSTVTHKKAMLSLDKIHNSHDLEKFLDKYPDNNWACWPKFDGISLSLWYENGKLLKAVSRGNGKEGEDLTDNLINVDGIKEEISDLREIEIRGEVVMLKSDFDNYNNLHPDDKLANPRNAVSGTLRTKINNKNKNKIANRKLTFYAYDVIVYNGDDKETIGTNLGKLNYNLEHYKEYKNKADILNYVKSLEDDKNNLNYLADGAVIRIADNKSYDNLGFTSKHPRGAIAYKWAAEITETTLLGVNWFVGKTGQITPVGKINPVYLAGANLTQVSLHNYNEITNKQLKINARIKIKRAGEVIPYVIGLADKQLTTNLTDVNYPKNCPSCNAKTNLIGNSQLLFCSNKLSCPAQNQRKLEYWVSKKGLDIESLSTKHLNKLIENNLVNDFTDLYKLKNDKEKLIKIFYANENNSEAYKDYLNGKKEPIMVNKILDNIEKSKSKGFEKVLRSLSINGISTSMTTKLVQAGYDSFDKIANAKREDLVEIEDMGEILADNLLDYFKDNQSLINKIKELDLDLSVKGNYVTSNGKTVCITGSFDIPRDIIKEKLEAKGYKVSSSISKSLDYLVAGEKAGTKLSKAEKLNVEIINDYNSLL